MLEKIEIIEKDITIFGIIMKQITGDTLPKKAEKDKSRSGATVDRARPVGRRPLSRWAGRGANDSDPDDLPPASPHGNHLDGRFGEFLDAIEVPAGSRW